MSMKLREFISAVRQCKSASEESTLVAKESAAIRTAFKDESSPYRHRNVAKLMFINMLGYNVLFGQMECLKLIASSHFLEKRLGYIAMSVLLDQTSDLLMLATNTIKNDLSCGNQYIISAALTALGNIGTAEMTETLSREIDDILNGTNPSLRKRAILLAAKMVRSNPNTGPKFGLKVATFLNDYNHSVIVSTAVLVEALLTAGPVENSQRLIEAIPTLCRLERELIGGSPSLAAASRAQNANLPSPATYGYRTGTTASLEYDFNGVNDPFLQARIIRCFRSFVERCPELMATHEYLDLIMEVTQFLLTPSDNYRNGALSLVYEAIRLALSLCHLLGTASDSVSSEIVLSSPSASPRNPKESCKQLQRLSLEWLDHFLSQKDNTVKYVAISVLTEVAVVFPDLVKKYRSTVIDSLKEGDASIQLKAVALVATLTDNSNAVEMTTELLNFLLVITDPLPTVKAPEVPLGKDVSFAEGTTVIVAASTQSSSHVQLESETQAKSVLVKLVIEKIEYAIDNYAISRSWQLDSLIRLCCLAGNVISKETKEKIVNTLLETPELQTPAVGRLATALQENMFQIALAEIATWCLGEFVGEGTSADTASSAGNAILNDLLDDTPKHTDSPPTSGLLEDELESGSAERVVAGQVLSPKQALDLIESMAKVYGFVFQAPHAGSSDVPGLVQNRHQHGVYAPVDGGMDCIKRKPDPTRHATKPEFFSIHPQAALPQPAVQALSNSMLPSLMVTAMAKIAAKQPSLRSRVISIFEQLQSACLSFELLSRINEYHILLEAAVFNSGGRELLCARAQISRRKNRQPQVPIGEATRMVSSWPTRAELISTEFSAHTHPTSAPQRATSSSEVLGDLLSDW